MRKGKPYPSDLRDAEWYVLEPLVPRVKPSGRPENYPRRELLNGMRYVLRTGCSWRSVSYDRLRGDLRESMGRHHHASAGILDSQSVKTTEKGGFEDTMRGKK